MSGDVVQSVRDRWSHVTATWMNNKQTGVSHLGETPQRPHRIVKKIK